jgi:hypothetical protein
LVLFAGGGCSHLARSRAKTASALEEHSRALTSGVVDALRFQPAEHRDAPAALALELARENERIQGLPAHPIAVKEMLGIADSGAPTEPSEMQKKQRAAREDLQDRFSSIEHLVNRERDLSEHLVQLGSTFEQQQNHSRRAWAKLIGSSIGILGMLVALALFAPAALPLAGRLIGWLIGKIPSAAGAVGVVSVKAFDSVVRAVESTKQNAPPAQGVKPLANEMNSSGPLVGDSVSANGTGESLAVLQANLSRFMDAEHKALVKARKGALGL